LSENRSYNKSELQAILHWKLGDAYKNIKDKKVAELEQLHWEQLQFNAPDVLLPPFPDNPCLSHIDNMELGQAKQRQFQKMLESSSDCDDDSCSNLQMLSWDCVQIQCKE
jgi:hypothetical protein